MSFVLRPFLRGEEVQFLVGGVARVKRWHEYENTFKSKGILQWEPLQVVPVPYKQRVYLMNVTRRQNGDYLSWNFVGSLILSSWMDASPWVMVGNQLWVWNYYSDDLDSPLAWNDSGQFVLQSRTTEPSTPLTFPIEANPELYKVLPRFSELSGIGRRAKHPPLP